MQNIHYVQIGVIHTPFKTPEGAPIQNEGAKGVKGFIEIHDELVEGLSDLAGFSHIYLIYHFHLASSFKLKVKPFMDQTLRGVFATRAPARPNAIGISLVRLKAIRGRFVDILDIDVVDGTPLLDIKPYVPRFDNRPDARTGWLEGKADQAADIRADNRFAG